MVNATETAFTILEYISEHNSARVTELADELGCAKSTIHRHLRTLEELEYLVNEGGHYYLALQFVSLAENAKARNPALQFAKPKVEQLAKKTEERVQFFVEEHGYIVSILRETGEQAVRTNTPLGLKLRPHAHASGKAILANLSEEQVLAIIDRHGLPALTENTITDPEALLSELERVSERGYAYNKEESLDGLNAAGVAITDPTGRVLGALSVSGPSYRLDSDYLESELPKLLMGAANEIEINVASA